MPRKKSNCKICGHDKLNYSEEYDSYYCPLCMEWNERKCSDLECLFCSKRPNKPNKDLVVKIGT